MSGFLDNLLIVICTSGGEKHCACDLSYVRPGFSVINKQERENAECFDNGRLSSKEELVHRNQSRTEHAAAAITRLRLQPQFIHSETESKLIEKASLQVRFYAFAILRKPPRLSLTIPVYFHCREFTIQITNWSYSRSDGGGLNSAGVKEFLCTSGDSISFPRIF